ncbi:PH domain-containing protein [Brachybacterium sp. Marseille-Q7125]|uniref:PH domain-containing protein n=1 Tax=Brachybacterium sp. Marseille-Q7125 TaxID=2932815 RepID=UPI001FF305D5|nr:PH domain-containing protein [Brachybacterium sp. Marseille-Q7125]
MTSRRVRSSNSTAVIWIGVLLLLMGGFTGLYGLVPLLQGSALAGIAWLLVGALIGALGLLAALFGWRTHARVDAQGISWSHGFSRRTAVPWQQIAYVQVPSAHEPGGSVILHLHDGRQVPVTPLRKTQGPDDSTALSPWYLRAGAAVQKAHQEWLTRGGR